MYTSIQRIWAAEPERIEAAVRDYPGAFRDGILLATFAGLRIGPRAVRDFRVQKAFVERLKARGVDVQIGVSSTIGHSDDWTRRNPFPKMVGEDGAVAKAIACPRSRAFARHLRAVFARYARLGPSVLWLDDDFRLPHHPPLAFGCFCPDCLARFAAETGIALPREALVREICAGGKARGMSVRRAWRDFGSRALTELVGEIAGAMHAVDDRIGLGFMACNGQGLVAAPPDYRAWIERARNRDGAVWFRHGSGAYHDREPYGADGLVAKNVAIAQACAATEGPGVTNLTEEVTVPYCRRGKSLRMTFLEAALNIGLAGADGATYDAIKPNLGEQLSPGGVVSMLHARRAELDRMRALVEGGRQLGVLPESDPGGWGSSAPVASLADLGSRGNADWLPLLYLGVPFSFRKADACARLPRRVWRENDVWGRDAGRAVKDGLDRLCGGRLPARADTAVRLALSLWERPGGAERVAFLFNLDFDDADDVRLRLDGRYSASLLLPGGGWLPLRSGDDIALPSLPAWAPAVVRLRRLRGNDRALPPG